MPVIRELKYPADILARYVAEGTCVSVGMDVWFIEKKKLRIGVIQSVDEGGDTITILDPDGKPRKLNPMDLILFVEAPKGLKAKA